MEFTSWLCLAVPSGTPAALTGELNADVRDILEAPVFTKRLMELGSVPKPTSPEQARHIVADEIARWADVIKRGNIKVD